MSSVLITVFILQLVIYLVNNVGTAAINEFLWILLNRLPLPSSQEAEKQRRLKTEYQRLRLELNKTSSANEFAKWAKLRRQHDKVLADLEKTTASSKGFKGSFDKTVTVARWAGTNGFRLFLQFWYSKTPLFWIPQGWLPYYVEWLLAFPRAPTGSISIQIWGIACATVIQLLGDVIVGSYTFILGSGARRREQPQMASASGNPLGPRADSSSGERKKEL
ncbi:MAG: GET complex subunit get1 [Piccolia ochrophora]|nr:MAG: GET complex subunit get1 [Piccolia ochrophora]